MEEHWIKIHLVNGTGLIYVFNEEAILIHVYCVLDWEIINKVYYRMICGEPVICTTPIKKQLDRIAFML